MKKYIAIVAAIVIAAGGLGWYAFLRPHDRLALARAAAAKGEMRAAVLELRSAVLDDPANAEAHFRLGQAQLRLNDPIAAEKELAEAGRRGWDEAALRGPTADALLAQGRFDDVLKTMQPDGLPPDQASTVLIARATAELALKNNDGARDAAAEAWRLAPKSVDAALAVARVARFRGDKDVAEHAVAEALTIDPRSADALMLLAELRDALGDHDAALRALDSAVAAAPEWPVALMGRAQILIILQQDVRARADINKLLGRDPKSPLPNFLLAQVLTRAKDFAGADMALQRVGPVLSRLPRGEFLQAVIKTNLNEPEQALEAASRYVAHVPDDPAGYKLLARMALGIKRPGQAVEVLDRAVKNGHADAEALTLLGEANAQAGRGDAAVRAMQQVVTMNPNDATALTRLAALHLGTGDAGGAARDLEHALDMSTLQAGIGVDSLAAGTPTVTKVSESRLPAPPPPGAAATAPPPTQTAAALVIASLQAGEPDRAAAALERLRRLGGEAGQIASLDGLVKLGKLDFDGARAAFEEAGRIDPAALNPKIELGRVLVLQGKTADAEAVVRQAVASSPANLQALSAYVAILLGEGRTDAAVTAMEAAHDTAPNDAVLSVGLADLYTRVNKADKALALLDGMSTAALTAAAMPPATNAANPAAPSPDAVKLAIAGARTRAHLALGHRPEAIESLRQIVALRPDDVTVRRQLVDQLLAQNDIEGARDSVREGIVRQPGNPVLMSAEVAAAARAGGIQAGLDAATQLARDPQNQPAARLLKGDLYASQKMYAEAGAALAAELRDDGPSIVAVRAAQAFSAAGKTDEANKLLRGWLATHPDSLEVALTLSSLDIAAKRIDDARQHLRAVLDRQPNNPSVLNNLAWVEQQQGGDLARARTLAQRGWLLAPTPQAADTLGWIMHQQGDRNSAISLLRLAAGGLKDDPVVQYHYAVALSDAGQRDAAAAVLTPVLAAPGAFDERDDARKLLDALSHS